MGPPSYMRSVVDRNVVMRRMTVFLIQSQVFTLTSVNVNLRYTPIPVDPRCKVQGLRPLGFWDCGFESRRWHVCVSCECSVLSEKDPATGRSLVQRSPTECCVSECDVETSTRVP